jgi:ribosomal protein S18 acetylase RimI-like enzyme
MSVDVRWAKPADAADLALILCELAVHYRQPPLTKDAALVAAQKWLDTESPAYPHFAIARRDGEAAGLASVAIAHPGIDLERLLFLKELYVRDGFRDAGIGLELVRFLAAHCLAEGIGRIDLTTEDWNEGAVRFYETLGAERHDQKIFLRFGTDRLRAIAGPREEPGS